MNLAVAFIYSSDISILSFAPLVHCSKCEYLLYTFKLVKHLYINPVLLLNFVSVYLKSYISTRHGYNYLNTEYTLRNPKLEQQPKCKTVTHGINSFRYKELKNME